MIEKYTEGMEMSQFERVDKISVYNSNYYIGIKGDLLYALSDDDNTTEWWVISDLEFIYIGESYTTGGEILHKYDSRCT